MSPRVFHRIRRAVLGYEKRAPAAAELSQMEQIHNRSHATGSRRPDVRLAQLRHWGHRIDAAAWNYARAYFPAI